MGLDLDKVFKALAAPERRLLLDRLHEDNGQTLGQLCEGMEMTRQAVTKHLKVLEDATLVATIWKGREKLHYLNPMPIHEIAEEHDPVGGFGGDAFEQLGEFQVATMDVPDGDEASVHAA